MSIASASAISLRWYYYIDFIFRERIKITQRLLLQLVIHPRPTCKYYYLNDQIIICFIQIGIQSRLRNIPMLSDYIRFSVLRICKLPEAGMSPQRTHKNISFETECHTLLYKAILYITQHRPITRGVYWLHVYPGLLPPPYTQEHKVMALQRQTYNISWQKNNAILLKWKIYAWHT